MGPKLFSPAHPRADAVKQFLSKKYGIEPGNLVTVGVVNAADK